MPQGKHMKTILEVPAGVLVKHESSLGEACAVSPYPSAEPPSNLHTSPRLSITLRCHWRKTIPVLSPSQTTWAPAGVLGPAVLQGLRETTLWEPRGQAGGAMEDVLPETLGDRLPGKEVRHPEPS